MKNKFAKFFSILLCCMLAFLFVGCSGNDSDYADNLKQAYENGELSYEDYIKARQEAMSVPLYGTKVLYKPTEYNWDDNVGEKNTNYYEQYAWWILRELITFYGVVREDDETIKNYNTENPDNQITFPTGLNKTPYYDTIRYQMQEYSNATIKKVLLTANGTDSEGNTTYSQTEEASRDYFEITANTAKDWNWSFGGNNANNQALLYQTLFTNTLLNSIPFTVNDEIKYLPNNEYQIDNNNLQNIIATQNNFIERLDNNYNTNQISYSQIYLGGAYDVDKNDEEHNFQNYSYSDYVKALEYAIYCINLDLRPNTVRVTIDSDGMYKVQIDGYPEIGTPGNDGYKSSAQNAVDSIKEIFKKLGTYVGVTERQQARLKNWIKENIIGTDSESTVRVQQTEKTYTQFVKYVATADNNSDGVTDEKDLIDSNGDGVVDTNDDNIKEVLCDEYGNVQTTLNPKVEVDTAKTTTLTVERNYDKNLDAIIDICTKQVNIGNSSTEGEESQGPNIDDKFVASTIQDYFGNDFFISSDKGNEFKNIPSMEYQSMALMFSQKWEFSNIMLFFRYGYDNDGNLVVPEDSSIKINVYLHKYTKATNEWKVIPNPEGDADNPQFQIEVKAGPFDYGGKNNTLMMFGLKDKDQNGRRTGVRCNEWNREIGGGVINSITDGYIGLQSIGQPIQISGNTDARNYYQLVDRAVETNTAGDTTKYVSYGILNPAAFYADTNGCDYVEIAFEIVKDTYDQSSGNIKNYNFQVGFGLIDGPASRADLNW